MSVNGHDHSAPQSTVKITDMGGKHGWRVRWEFDQNGVAFTAFKIVARQPDGLKLAMFVKANAPDGELTPDVIVAEPYLSGAVKRDGRVCLFGGTAVFRGPVAFKYHLSFQKEIWLEAHAFLGSRHIAEEEWDDAK